MAAEIVGKSTRKFASLLRSELANLKFNKAGTTHIKKK
jgi:hypothetical protein